MKHCAPFQARGGLAGETLAGETITGEAMIATSHPVATTTGLRCLLEGGNAVDAALSACAVLSIAEPHMTGIGGDCFALVMPPDAPEPYALNGSGRAPKRATIEALQSLGVDQLEPHSPHSVTIPGAVSGWWSLHQRFGRKDWDQILQPAIKYAAKGIGVHARVAWDWSLDWSNLTKDPDTASIYLHNHQPYGFGMRFANPTLAETLNLIADQGPDGFYQGAVRDDLLGKLNRLGGLHCEDDFATIAAEFLDPIATDALGHTIWQCPPNGQGLAALVLVRILERFEFETLDSADQIHLLAEAGKQAYHLRDQSIADPDFICVPIEELLADGNIAALADQIDMHKARTASPSLLPTHPDTVYLCVVDGDGMAVSLMSSIFDSFGSAITAPKSGMLLHSRGRSFSLDPTHPNALEPGKRPLHTIIPAMLGKDQRLAGPFGVMGGQYQVIGQAGFLLNHFCNGMNVQAALDAPRSFAFDGVLQLESGLDSQIVTDLAARGHQIVQGSPRRPIMLGGGQAIMRNHETGLWHGGSDPRKDGMVAGF
ncbi:MAG: gamma-glutamyltransferase family protein [Pseudomonadota bacterium]